MENAKITLLGRLSVANKFGLIVVNFTAAIAGIIAYTVVTMQSTKQTATMQEVASHARMLSQRHLYEVMMAYDGFQADYATTRKLMQDGIFAIVNGGTAMIDLETRESRQLAPAPTFELREKAGEIRDLINESIAKADQLLATPKGDPGALERQKELIAIDKKLFNATNQLTTGMSKYSQSRVDTMIAGEISFAGMLTLLGLLLSMLIIRESSRPLAKMVDVTQKIAEGNLQIQKLDVNSKDEFGKLGQSINRMLDSLKNMTTQTWGVTQNLTSATTEILAATQQQAASAKQQAATVQQTTATMEQLRQSGTQISERAKEVSSTAEVTTTVTKSGIDAVGNTTQTMNAIQQQFETLAEHIVTLSEKAQAVSEIISNVNDIAEQSNLLALNASIEAAAAGEHGRSFSVVANEIKNLADQAKQSTFQVRSILSEIQRGINSSVMLTEEAVKRVESGKVTVDVAQQTITQMARITEQSILAFQQIIAATSQQHIGLEQIAGALKEILQSSQETATGTGQLEKAVTNLNLLGVQLKKGLEAYRI